MGDILWVEIHTGVAAELPYRIVSPDQAIDAIEAGEKFDTVGVGTSVSEPLRLARLLRGRDELVEILVVAGSVDREAALCESLRLDPFVGAHTSVVLADGDLRETVSQAAERTELRRRHHATLDSAQARLEAATPATTRPSPEKLAATMWSGSPVGALAILRDTHDILNANDAAMRLLEQDELALLGRRLEDVFSHAGDGGWTWLCEVSGDVHSERVVPVRRQGGEVVHIEVRAVEVEPQGGDVLMLFLWDVSERVRLAQLQADYLVAERRAREQAERASRIRQDVVATVSHDLRGPLQTLITSTYVLEALSDGSEDSRTVEIVQTVGRASKYMKRLVDDLLDVSRIEEGGIGLDYETVSVADIVSQATDLASGAASERGVILEQEPIDSSLTLSCDGVRLVQLLQNLLTNAIKFSSAGDTVIAAASQHDAHVRFSITDRGPGIRADELPHLFGRFWQADRSDKTGVGLGLAIARGIVDAHGGEISVQSTPGQGATFYVDLPCDKPAE